VGRGEGFAGGKGSPVTNRVCGCRRAHCPASSPSVRASRKVVSAPCAPPPPPRPSLSLVVRRHGHRMSTSVLELEKRLGIRLPADYRSFLVAHCDSLLEHPRLFIPPRSGVVDSLLTADEILKNDDQRQIGIPEKSLMHIGGNLLGGCLYMRVSSDALGEIHYMESYEFRERFPSFSAFLDETQPEAAP